MGFWWNRKIRVLWKYYYEDINSIIFVIDSNDKKRIDEAARKLKNVLNEEELIDCPILVLANKQDLRSSVSPGEITEKLGMKQLKGRKWLAQGTSAITGQGLKEGLD